MGRPIDARWMLLRNLVTSVIEYERAKRKEERLQKIREGRHEEEGEAPVW